MFKKLRNKFLILNMAVTSLIVLTAFGVVYLSTYNNILKENHRKLNGMSSSLVRAFESSTEQRESTQGGGTSDKREQGPTINIVSSDSPPSFTLIVDKHGSIMEADPMGDLPTETYSEAAAAAWGKGGQSTISLSGRIWMYAIAPLSITELYEDGHSVTRVSDDTYRISFLDITDTQKTLRDLWLTLIIVGLGVLTVISVISYYFANRSIRPIAAAWKRQQQFIADASHELKTPLSTITANYDALLANQDKTIRSQREWLEYMKIGTDRMTRLINNMLILAAMEEVSFEVSKAPFDISDTLHQEIASMEAAAIDKELILSTSIQPGIMINSNQEMVCQVFAILFENAVKYSDPLGKINVSLNKNRHRVVCSIENSGKGIAKTDLPRIFDRFYRADKSRTGENGGYGLGLSIAKTMMDQLGGSIAVTSTENEWTVFTFALEEFL